MYYSIEQDQLKLTEAQLWLEQDQGVCIFSSEEWEKESSLKRDHFVNLQRDPIRFCKLESSGTQLFGTIHVPAKKEVRKQGIFAAGFGFAFYIVKNRVIFVDDTGMVYSIVERMAAEKKRPGYTLSRCLYEFFVLLLEEDLVYMTSIEHEIALVEEEILSGNLERLNQRMMRWKKEISRLYRYYSQLSDVGEGLTDYEEDFFTMEKGFSFKILVERVDRLQSEAQILREYAMQVQDVYHSEISIRQNDVMKVLTIVTTIFLPLTLIVGWYGMNFAVMPELHWKYGYPAVIGLSVLVALICIWIFKRKKLW